jgi:Fe2+ transport system protein FeoA
MSRSDERTVSCSLCGHAFRPAGLACHAGCPLGERCGLICCPNCGYETIDGSSSRLVRLLWRRRPAADGSGRPRRAGAVPLTHAADGVDLEVESLDGMSPERSARLSAFGLVPGSLVRILQRRPVPLLRIGETELAVSEDVLGEVWVLPEPSISSR